eukprot:gene12862-8743_t
MAHGVGMYTSGGEVRHPWSAAVACRSLQREMECRGSGADQERKWRNTADRIHALWRCQHDAAGRFLMASLFNDQPWESRGTADGMREVLLDAGRHVAQSSPPLEIEITNQFMRRILEGRYTALIDRPGRKRCRPTHDAADEMNSFDNTPATTFSAGGCRASTLFRVMPLHERSTAALRHEAERASSTLIRPEAVIQAPGWTTVASSTGSSDDASEPEGAEATPPPDPDTRDDSQTAFVTDGELVQINGRLEVRPFRSGRRRRKPKGGTLLRLRRPGAALSSPRPRAAPQRARAGPTKTREEMLALLTAWQLPRRLHEALRIGMEPPGPEGEGEGNAYGGEKYFFISLLPVLPLGSLTCPSTTCTAPASKGGHHPMASEFWARDGEGTGDPLDAEALEQLLLASLSRNPLSAAGLDIPPSSRGLGFPGCLGPDHPLRRRCADVARACGLPQRPALQHSTEEEQPPEADAERCAAEPAAPERSRQACGRAKARTAAPDAAGSPMPAVASQEESSLPGPEEPGQKRPRAPPDDGDEDEEFGVPARLLHRGAAAPAELLQAAANPLEGKHPSQMTREEFLSQYKRAPRRGEIGQSAEDIQGAEALGYVMSGSRSKAAQLFVNRVQRQLHERDAAKLDQQFRQVEDQRTNELFVNGLRDLVQKKLEEGKGSAYGVISHPQEYQILTLCVFGSMGNYAACELKVQKPANKDTMTESKEPTQAPGEAPRDPSNCPSLSVSTLLGKAIAVGVGEHILLGRFSAITASAGTVLDTTQIHDRQQVRSVAFLQIPDGPLCVVSGGDGKYINLYNISSAEEHRSASDRSAGMQPCYTYGPHTKRITHVAACEEGVVVFADKFGEVFRLGLCWSPDHRVEPEGSAAAPASFLLQHFSFFTCVFLTSPVLRPEDLAASVERSSSCCRRLFTCDKDCHARYLWPPHPSPVTVVTEVADSVEGAINAAGALSHYVLGHLDGSVSFWAAHNNVSSHAKQLSFSLVRTFSRDADNCGGVVGLSYAAANRDSSGNLRHPDDTPRGFFAARDGSAEVLLYPLLSGGQHGLLVPEQHVQRVTLPHPIVALRRCTKDSAVALTRAGTLHFIELQACSVVGRDRPVDQQRWAASLLETHRMDAMERSLQKLCNGVVDGGPSVALACLNLWEQWQQDGMDPRNRKRPHSEDAEGASSDSESNVKIPTAEQRSTAMIDNCLVLFRRHCTGSVFWPIRRSTFLFIKWHSYCYFQRWSSLDGLRLMGNYLSIPTHATVPPEVKAAIPPIDFLPAEESELDTETPLCEDCGQYFGWWVPPTNCCWCGARRCQRCAPQRHLLGDRPGCAECTQTAYRMRRAQMLRQHYDNVGIRQPVPAVPLPPTLARRELAHDVFEGIPASVAGVDPADGIPQNAEVVDAATKEGGKERGLASTTPDGYEVVQTLHHSPEMKHLRMPSMIFYVSLLRYLSDTMGSDTIKASDITIPRYQVLGMSGLAGMFAWCFTHPFEMWKNTVMMSPTGTSQIEAFKTTAKKGFYTGLSSGLMRQVVARLLGLKADANPANANLFDRALAGASAGVFASFLSSPVEVCLVLQTTNKEKPSILQAARGILASSGPAGFWSGFGALGSRAALVGIAQVAVHDQVLTTLRGINEKRPERLNDNLVVNMASVITSFIYSAITMPVECARVRMSAEAKRAAGCIGRMTREEGFLAMYDAFLPYFSRCATHTVLCFFVIEYCNRQIKQRKLLPWASALSSRAVWPQLPSGLLSFHFLLFDFSLLASPFGLRTTPLPWREALKSIRSHHQQYSSRSFSLRRIPLHPPFHIRRSTTRHDSHQL